MKNLNFVLVLFLFSGTLIAQTPKFSNDFLNIGVGARGMALGSAVSSLSADVTSGYWNPSLLPMGTAKFQVAGQHAQWYAGIGNYDFIAFGKKLDSEGRSFGSISLIRMGIDNIPNTLRLRAQDGSIDYNRISSFSVADYALLISYGRKVKFSEDGLRGFNLGASAKVIHRSFGSFANSIGFGFDASMSFLSGNWRVCIMGRDITTTFNAFKFSFSDEEKSTLQITGNEIPASSIEITLPKIIAGLSYQIELGRSVGMTPSFDIEFSGNGTSTQLISSGNFGIDPRIGVEIDIRKKVFFRVGANNFQYIPSLIEPNKREITIQPSGGLGLKFKRISLDYALTNIGNVGAGLYSHYISLMLDF
ncbi:MAG: hypothetical protein IT267_03525 [Saprospiraceae bacterium]|nr:hypothetical protein [Saprospiraceae bacterium]